MSVHRGHSGKHLLAAGISHFDPLDGHDYQPVGCWRILTETWSITATCSLVSDRMLVPWRYRSTTLIEVFIWLDECLLALTTTALGWRGSMGVQYFTPRIEQHNVET